MPRFKRLLPERYLTTAEYRRLAGVLAEDDERYPLDVAMIRLLICTGARHGEIADRHWDWVQPGRLMLPDSKTGPKIVYLNPQAEAVLANVPRPPAATWSSRHARPTVRASSTPSLGASVGLEDLVGTGRFGAA